MFQGDDSFFINYAKKLNSNEFREISDTDNSNESRDNKTDNTSNKNENESNFEKSNQLTFTCSKSTIETLEKGVKYVQS